MRVEIYFDDDKELTLMSAFSKWFTKNRIVPNEGENLFVPDDDPNFPEEGKKSGSTQWFVSKKFFEPKRDVIIIWCKDIADK
jgi:DNA gyrase inhibitor GyrI